MGYDFFVCKKQPPSLPYSADRLLIGIFNDFVLLISDIVKEKRYFRFFFLIYLNEY